MDTFCAFLNCASTWIGNISIITSWISPVIADVCQTCASSIPSIISALPGMIQAICPM